MEELKLTINMLPKGTWNNDFSKTLSKKDWDKLRNFALNRANGSCEICGYKTDDLDVHEEWDFDVNKKTQTLKYIKAICSRCHGVKHFKNSVRLGFGEDAEEHFIKVNKCTDMQFASHLNKALLEYEERNKIFRWKIIANLEKYGGTGIEFKQNNIPFIKNPYANVDWEDYDLIKNNYKSFFIINSKNLYYPEPSILSLVVDNYQGVITINCDNINKIEWYLDEEKVKTQYDVIGTFTTNIKIKNLFGKQLVFKAMGKGGEIISKPFELLPQEVL